MSTISDAPVSPSAGVHPESQPAGVVQQRPMPLPEDRGPASRAVLAALRGGDTDALEGVIAAALQDAADVLTSDDLQLALFCLYELHYGGIEGVDDALEWSPALLAARSAIEGPFEVAVRALVGPLPECEPTSAAVAATLFAMTAEEGGPSLAKTVAKRATLDQLRELLVQRTIYTLKEADPHSWAIARLSGVSKAALVEIQADEYGGGRPDRVHSAIFVRTLSAAGLDTRYGAYVDLVPAVTLAALNVMSLFGLHRRLRGAVVGHLAAFEMTSSIPSRLMSTGLRRLGFDEDATWYYDEHVEADAVHEQIAGHDLAGGLVVAEPALLPDVLLGAAACMALEGAVGRHIQEAWSAGGSSLREPLP